MRLVMLSIGKQAFYTIKTPIIKNRKKCFLAKEIVHSFGQKFEIFPSFHFSKIGKKKVLVDILYRRKVFLDKQKSLWNMLKNIVFFQRG